MGTCQKKQLGRYPESPKAMIELWTGVEVIGHKIDLKIFQRLVEGMLSRFQAFLRAKGVPTKY